MVARPVSGGSSPHTRGARGVEVRPPTRWRIIPAYAGSTCPPARTWPPSGDHPRIRGEHRFTMVRLGDMAGSSPHTRGALVDDDRASHGGGIIPAYAGSTRAQSCTASPAPDHPRIRGEHSFRDKRGGAYDGSSPHTRGARRDPSRIPWVSRIIPAYAGSTLIPCSRATSSSDHPRIRGEHDLRPCFIGQTAGSSPHTRGAPGSSSPARRRRGIIPAYAGSTEACT